MWDGNGVIRCMCDGREGMRTGVGLLSEGFLALGVHGEVIVLVQDLHGLVNSDGRRRTLVSTADGQLHTRTSTWTPEASLTNLGITSFPPWISLESFWGVRAWVVSNETRKIIRVSAEFVKVEKPSNCGVFKGLGFPRIRTGTPSQRPP